MDRFISDTNIMDKEVMDRIIMNTNIINKDIIKRWVDQSAINLQLNFELKLILSLTS